jgi:hypothetical protein
VPIVRYFTLQLYQTADVSYVPNLLPYIRYKWKGTLLKDILSIGENRNHFSTFSGIEFSKKNGIDCNVAVTYTVTVQRQWQEDIVD